MMTKEEMITYWRNSADEDVETAEAMFTTKRYLPCLFYCHLFVEKMIKALIVKSTGEPAPYEHKLSRLAQLTAVEFSEKQRELLRELTAFNINTRYEDYKFAIYKKATAQFTDRYCKDAKELFIWLKAKL